MIDRVPPPKPKDLALQRIEYLEQNASVEVVEPGFQSVTNVEDIVAMSEPISDESSPGTKQILLQVVDTVEGSFGVVAAKGEDDGTALLITKLGDGRRRAIVAGSVPGDGELSISGFEGSPLFTVSATQTGEIIIGNLIQPTPVDVYTNLEPDAAKHDRRTSYASMAKSLEIGRRRPSDFAPKPENPFEDYRTWAPLSATVKGLIRKADE